MSQHNLGALSGGVSDESLTVTAADGAGGGRSNNGAAYE